MGSAEMPVFVGSAGSGVGERRAGKRLLISRFQVRVLEGALPFSFASHRTASPDIATGKGPSASVRGPLFLSQHDRVQASAGHLGRPDYSLNGRFGKWYSVDSSNGCQLGSRRRRA
jgi:hypothetical protein